jgi:hypothetical protein
MTSLNPLPSGPRELSIIAAARANANLDPTPPSAEIAGVDLDPIDAVDVSDDELDDDEGED